jgi:hypothetical protein
MAPRRYRRYISYITGKLFPPRLLHLKLLSFSYLLHIGWLCAITWQTSVAGGSYFAGTLIQGLFVLNVKNYNFERWHGTLLTFAFLLVALVFNTFLARKLPMVEGLFVICHILGIVIFIPLLFLSPRRSGGSPLVEFYNPGGWSSEGLATMIGTLSPTAALIGFDCSIHMGMLSLHLLPTFLPNCHVAEEAKDSSRSVPMTLISGYAANILLGFFALMTW